MSDLVKRACDHVCDLLGLSPDRILSSKEYPDRVVLILDNGIAGAPKWTIMLDDLPTIEKAKPKPAKRTRRTTKKAAK